MSYAFKFFMLLLSGSVSAKVLTFECTPDDFSRKNRELHVFAVDTTSNTLEMKNDVFFPDTVFSEGVISAERKRGYLPNIVQIYRGDLKYKKLSG